MKTRYLLPALLALGAVATSSQAIADGLTYDPYANYYGQYYGIDMNSTATNDTETAAEAFYDPYADYYNTYYGTDDLLDKSEAKSLPEKSTDSVANVLEDYPDMADPTNYFKW